MGNRQLHSVTLTGDEHLFGVAQRVGHWLLAQNCLRTVGSRRDRPGGVTAVPDTDGDHIRALLFHHFSGVGVMVGADAVALVLLGHGRGVDVGQRDNFIAPGIQITGYVVVGNAAAANHRGA
jgi:hypothetical protein